ncbi:MAG: pseudouridine-5'-phosphate glycosidase [Erysipelotrichaceae bacterium]|nr:pseudouridine-5'-phosphate glycosidase [Erysipelotrichaceae bacterium]
MYLRVSDEVKKAIQENKPVVALESTIISHGMPYPQNVKTALEVEKIIRDNGCIPATIGIIDGIVVVGMNPDEIEEFGKRKGIEKVSRRDVPVIMAKKEWGATTVATTMLFASMANIEVFVTGGIGGVHRGAETTFDISADLQELANTNVTVICAGAKAILDLGLTLEYLETFGVPVLGYKTKTLPAFYSRTSKFSVDYKMDSADEIANVIKAKRDMKLDGGVLVTNPIPEEYSLDEAKMDEVIKEAIQEMDKAGVHGKESTPYLLGKVKELTGGSSLESNIQLVFNNARLGSEIAKKYCELKG